MGKSPQPESGLLRNKIADSVRWTFGTTAVTAVLQFGLAAMMARLLDPSAFGLLAVANGILRYLGYLTDFGGSSVAIRSPHFDATDQTLLTGQSVLIAMGLVGLSALIMPWSPMLFPKADGEIGSIFLCLSLGLVLSALSTGAAAHLQRDLRFSAISRVGLISMLVGQAGIALPLAWMGMGVWALVAGALSQAAFQTALLLWMRPLCWPYQDWRQRYQSLLALGGRFSLLRIMDASLNLVPSLSLGILAGVTVAGLYDRAFVLAIVPFELISNIVNRVLAPAYGAKSHQDQAAMGQMFLSVLRLMGWSLFPLSAGIMVAAPLLTGVILGPHWTEAAPMVRILALWAIFRSFSTCCGTVIDVAGSLRLRFYHRISTLVLVVGGLIWLRPSDGGQILWFLTVCEAVSTLALIFIAAKTANLPVFRLFSAIMPALFPAMITMLLVGLVPWAGFDGFPALLLSVLAGICGMVLGILGWPAGEMRADLAHYVGYSLLHIPVDGHSWPSRLCSWLAKV